MRFTVVSVVAVADEVVAVAVVVADDDVVHVVIAVVVVVAFLHSKKYSVGVKKILLWRSFTQLFDLLIWTKTWPCGQLRVPRLAPLELRLSAQRQLTEVAPP